MQTFLLHKVGLGLLEDMKIVLTIFFAASEVQKLLENLKKMQRHSVPITKF